MKKRIFVCLVVLLFVPEVFSYSFAENDNLSNRLSKKIEKSIIQKRKQTTSLPDQYRQILLDRFLRYVQIDSQSVYGPHNSFVLSEDVKNAADQLYAELQEMIQGNSTGVNLYMSEWKYIYVHFPSNLPKKTANRVPTLGFSCHYDVTPEAIGHNIKPHVHKNYDGGTIWINKEQDKFLNQQTDPYLANLIGETIVTSDGTTLLGADDKAGTSVLVTTIQTLLEHPEIPHGKIQIVFTPNEDVGQSAYKLDYPKYYNPDIAFDFDGEVNGQIMTENFTAVGYNIIIPGRSAHGGNAKKENGLDPNQVAGHFLAAIPDNWWPQNSEKREHYFHAFDYQKTPGDTVYINVRSRFFDQKDGNMHEEFVKETTDSLNKRYNTNITYEKSLQYENVAYGVHPLAKSIAFKAVSDAGMTPYADPVRGGTTTAMFNAMWGITGYTYFTGQQREHTTKEWLSEKDMFASYKTALNTIREVIIQSTKKQ